jgi:hypothetical protein
MNIEQIEMLEKVVADRLPHLDIGDQAVVSMLTIVSHQLNELIRLQATIAEQFDRVSGGGNALLTESN